jgi:hypothetical protein
MICLLAAFILPFIIVPQQFSLQTNSIQFTSPVPSAPVVTDHFTVRPQKAVTPIISQANVPKEWPMQRIIKWIFAAYWCGVIIFAVNFLLQIITLLLMVYKKPVIKDGIYRIVELTGDKAPCSFGNYIFINPSKYDWETYNQILMHEKVHIQQRHSIDLIMAELMLVMQWFNPFAWLYRKQIENNLEFLTDDLMLYDYKVEPADYQLSLLKVSVPNFALHLTTSYNQSFLKKRIIVMNAKRSNIHIVWKYFTLVPLFILLVFSLNKSAAINSPLAKQRQFMPNGTSISNHTDPKKTSKTPLTKARLPDPVTHINSSNSKKITIADSGLVSTKLFSANDIIFLQNHGITVQYAYDLSDAGYKDLNLDNIIFLHSHGITAEYIKGLSRAGYKDLNLDNVNFLHSRGIPTEYIQGLSDAGYKNPSLDNINSLYSHKIPTEYIQALSNAGYRNLSLDNINYLHSNGVTAEYIKGFADAGYRNFTINDIISLKAHGITPSSIKDTSSKRNK